MYRDISLYHPQRWKLGIAFRLDYIGLVHLDCMGNQNLRKVGEEENGVVATRAFHKWVSSTTKA